MAIRAGDERMLKPAMARAAGAVCAILALAAAVAPAVMLLAGQMAGAAELVRLGWWVWVWAAMWLIVAGAGVQLFGRRAAAQTVSLVFWLLFAAAAVTAILAGLLWGTGWWPLPVPLGAASAVAMLAGLVAATMLVAASAERSPLRYSSYATVSLVAAAALAVAVNLIAQDLYVHRDVQQLGRYGLSDRTRKILATVKSPVRLTCVYTSTEENANASDYRPAVLELLSDMHERNANIEVADAASDSAKAKVVARLRQQLTSKAGAHQQFLEDFRRRGEDLSTALTEQQTAWAQLGDQSYLAMWAMTADVWQALQQASQSLDQGRNKVAMELTGAGLPDYAGLADQAAKTLTTIRGNLQAASKLLADIAKIPEAASANSQQAVEKLVALRKSVARLQQVMAGAEGAAEPSSKLLQEAAAAARDAADAALAAAKAVENVAGPDRARLVSAASPLQLAIPSGMFEVRSNVPQFLQKYVAAGLRDTADAIDAVAKVAKPEYYAQSIKKMRAETGQLSATVDQVVPVAEEALARLAKVDEPSRQVLQLAEEGRLFQPVTDILTPLVEQAEKLPALKSDELATDIVGDNIVIVEAGGKASAVPFDEVWPLKVTRWSDAQGEVQSGQRVFNGDSALASRILSITSQPFAAVLLTYYSPPGEEARMMPRADITPADLTTLRRRLEEANFEVTEWNLADPRPPVAEGRPQALLVLPPPPSLPGPMGAAGGFGKEHLDKVSEAIDSGTPAIFLTQFLWPRQMLFMPPISPQYGYADYLRTQWGIDVKCDYLVIPAVADESQPGRYKIAPVRFTYVPLSTFTDQPIGRPLQAQRALWTALAPILLLQDRPDTVTIEPVLGVPASWRSTWATRRLEELQAQLDTQGQYIWPDYQAGDIAPPFDVAVAAARRGPREAQAAPSPSRGTGTQPATASAPSSMPATAAAVAPARIVVMTLGAGLVDGYLDQHVAQLDAAGGLSLTDPPRANADVVTNSVYWLIGREALIGAGPAQIRPVEMIKPTTMNLLRAGYLVGLPLAVVAIGMLVMLARRRC